jgi:hypothetical protein
VRKGPRLGEMAAARKEEKQEISPGGWEMAGRANPAVDGKQASHSTSSVSTGEDEDLYSEENSYTESVGDYFHRIFSKRCGAICRYIWRCSNAQFVPIFQPKS